MTKITPQALVELGFRPFINDGTTHWYKGDKCIVQIGNDFYTLGGRFIIDSVEVLKRLVPTAENIRVKDVSDSINIDIQTTDK